MKPLSFAAAAILAAALSHPATAQDVSGLDSVVYHGPTKADLPRELTLVKPGMRVRLWNPDSIGYRRPGTLQRLTADSIFITRADGVVVGRDVAGLDGIEISRGRSRGAGALRGAVAGFGVGGVLLPLSGLTHRPEGGLDFKTLVKPTNYLIGAAVGTVIGGLSGVERWKRVAAATPEELAASAARPAPSASVAPRFVVAAYGGGLGQRDVKATADFAGPRGSRLTTDFTHRMERRPLVGVEVEAPGRGRVGVLAGAAYTLGSSEPGDPSTDTPFVTSGKGMLLMKLGASVHLPTAIPTSVHLAPLMLRETAHTGDWFEGSQMHWGGNLGVAADVPVSPHAHIRFAADDNVIHWNTGAFEDRLRAHYPSADFHVQSASLTHLITLQAGLAYAL
jgi:hypothetical protein